MRKLIELKGVTTFICHFVSEEIRPAYPYYQCTIDPNNPETFSPSKEFVRFNQAVTHGLPVSEIHGWRRIEDIVIDEILEELEAKQEAA